MADGETPPRDTDDGTDRQPAPDEVYCTNCGAAISRAAEICPECGVRQLTDPTAGGGGGGVAAGGGSENEKDPGLAAVLSFFVTGLGQIYNGEIGKGIALMLVQAFNFVLIFFLIGLFTFPVVWLFGIYDAYQSAERINERRTGV